MEKTKVYGRKQAGRAWLLTTGITVAGLGHEEVQKQVSSKAIRLGLTKKPQIDSIAT